MPDPSRSGNDLITATLYRGIGQSIIAVAGWGNNDVHCALMIEWKKLGLDPEHTTISIPPIRDFQEGRQPVTLENLTIPSGKGYLIVLEKKTG